MPDVVPDRLLRRGRPVDPIFEPQEDLYRACNRSEVHDDRLIPDQIGFREWSVNRGKYSEPRDVLIGREMWGIALFKVCDIPTPLFSETRIAFGFCVEHVPVDENYSHSQIVARRNGTYCPKPPEMVKKQYRLTLSDRAQIILRPQA